MFKLFKASPGRNDVTPAKSAKISSRASREPRGVVVSLLLVGYLIWKCEWS